MSQPFGFPPTAAEPFARESGDRPSPSGAEPEGISQPRMSVLEFVRRTPGCIIGDVATELGMSRTTAAHHLGVLARRSWIARERQGRSVVHYAMDGEPVTTRLLPYIADARSRGIVVQLVSSIGKEWTVNSLANQVGCYHGYLLRTLRAMERHGFVHIVRPRGRYAVKATPQLVQAAPAALANHPL